MSSLENEYWPFQVTDESRYSDMVDKIKFLEAATVGGFKGFRFQSNSFGAESGTRSGFIIERSMTRQRWELRLNPDKKGGLSAYVSSFPAAGDALLNWLKGASVQDVLADVEEFLVTMGKSTSTHKIYEPVKDTTSSS